MQTQRGINNIRYYMYVSNKYIIKMHYITLHYITLHYITLHYITLHYITIIHSFGQSPSYYSGENRARCCQN